MSRTLIPYADLPVEAQKQRQAILDRRGAETLCKLVVEVGIDVVKVDASAINHHRYDPLSWWLYPADRDNTLWYHPQSVQGDEAALLGECLWTIAMVYVHDAARDECLTIDGQWVEVDQ